MMNPAERRQASHVLVLAGCVCGGLGLSMQLLQLLLAHPWLAMVALGAILAGTGLFIAVREDGVLPLLPEAALHALFDLSAVELVLGVRAALRDMRAGKGLDTVAAAHPGSWIVPLAALCLLNLDCDLAEDVLDGLDREVRSMAFRPGLAHLLPVGARRLLLGRTGTSKLEHGTEELLTPRNIAHRLVASQQQASASGTPAEPTRREDAADVHRSHAADVHRSHGGGLWLATRILHYTLVRVPLRALRRYLFDSALWRRYSAVPHAPPSGAFSRALRWFFFAPLAWLMRFVQLQFDEHHHEQPTKPALKGD